MSLDYAQFAKPLVHPGDHLRLDFMPPYKLTAGRLARRMGLRNRFHVERLMRGRARVTPDTALRLGKVFGTTPEFWLNLQNQHDLSTAAIAAREELATIMPLVA